MQYISSIIQFTKIGLYFGLPLEIITYIVSLANHLIACDMCKEVSSYLFYKKKCIICNVNRINCCHECWQIGKYHPFGYDCYRCDKWMCGTCCNKIRKINIPHRDSYRLVACKHCGYHQNLYDTFKEHTEWNFK